MKDFKALHITGFWSGNYYYRSFLPAMANGWMVSNEFVEGKPNDGQKLVGQMREADIIQFQRPNYSVSVELMQIAKQLNKIVVFDDDDTFKMNLGIVPANEKEMKLALEINENRNKALMMSHGATCTTEFLAKELREVNNNVCVLPNCIDPDDAFPVTQNDTGKPRILILGSVISNDDWHIAKKAILKVADRVTFVGLGVPDIGQEIYQDDVKFWKSLPDFEAHGFTPFGNYYNQIINLKVDLAIAPRADNYFNRCKSNLKFLETSLFQIPFIGQAYSDGLSPYQVNPKDNEFMTLVDFDENAWVEALENALENLPALKEKAIKAQEYVCDEYSIYNNAHKWKEFYQTLIK